jgi:hypothetical protein
MPFKMTMYFTGPGGVGWSESWYLNSSSATQAQQNALNIAGVRTNFLDTNYQQSFIRVGNLGAPPLSVLLPGAGAGFWAGRGVAPAVGVTHPNIAILFTVTSGLGHRRQVAFRGLAPSVLNAAWFADPANGVLSKVATDYANILNTNAAGLLYNNTPALKPITKFMPDPLLSGMAQVTSAAHGLATGQVITLYKLRSKPSFAGKKKIIVDSPNTFLLQGTDVGQIFYQGNGQYRVVAPLVDGALVFVLKRISTHKTGRPFALLRGRSLRRL